MNETKELNVIRVLYVEDSEHDVLAFCRALKKSGIHFDVVALSSAEKALELIGPNKESFDIIVSDQNLPQMKGLELVKGLSKKGVKLPSILITGLGNEDLAIEALKSGVTDYLVKDHQQAYLKLLPVVITEAIKKYRNRTERKQAEEALQESEKRLALALKGTQAGMWDWYVDSGKTVFNVRWAEMIGYTLEELEPVSIQTWNKFAHPDDLQKSNELLGKYFRGELDYYECEARMKHKNGKWIWVLDRGMISESDKNGNPVRVTGTHIDITARKKAEDELKASLAEKETLLHEIHHRVKNNMAVVSSLLGLQAHSMNDERFKEALMDSQNRVQSISAIHETLYQSENLSSVDMNTYLSKLAKAVAQFYSISSQINLKVEAQSVMIGAKQASPLGLIINELITNSFKYAFPDNQKGEIKINLVKTTQDQIELTYKDNGIGIPEDFDWYNSKSMGLNLVKILAEGQLSGSVELIRDRGTFFIIKFKHKDIAVGALS